jgi:hypothetical protein
MLNLNGFQACDVRGAYGNSDSAEVSPLLAYLIGRSLARHVPAAAAVQLSGDGRASTPALLAALATGLNRPYLNLGAGVPTPLAYVARQMRQVHTTAIVTASHNPPAINGIKQQPPITPPGPACRSRSPYQPSTTRRGKVPGRRMRQPRSNCSPRPVAKPWPWTACTAVTPDTPGFCSPAWDTG